jgi:hypothetical protein
MLRRVWHSLLNTRKEEKKPSTRPGSSDGVSLQKGKAPPGSETSGLTSDDVGKIETSITQAAALGDERGLRLIARFEKDGLLGFSEARSLRLRFYRAMAAWAAESEKGVDAEMPASGAGSRHALPSGSAAEGEGAAPSSAGIGRKAGNRGRGGKRHSGSRTRLEAKARNKAEARQRRRTERHYVSSGAYPHAETVSSHLANLADIWGRHEIPSAVAAMKAFLASDIASEGIPPALAVPVLLWSEQLILDAHLPPALRDQLKTLSDEHVGGAALRARYAARTASPAPLGSARLVSLGFNCLPWTVPNRWGLRLEPDLAALDCPFNLAMHSFDTMIDAIRNDFAGYSDPVQIKKTRTPNGHEIAYNVRYKAVWNHEKNSYWIDNDYAILRKNLDLRIENFRNALKSEAIIFLVSIRSSFSSGEMTERLMELHDVLRAASHCTTMALIAVAQADAAAVSTTRTIAPAVFHIAMPWPDDPYIWHDEADFNAARGVDFERRYTEAIVAAARSCGMG